jgi:hypothetical protein
VQHDARFPVKYLLAGNPHDQKWGDDDAKSGGADGKPIERRNSDQVPRPSNAGLAFVQREKRHWAGKNKSGGLPDFAVITHNPRGFGRVMYFARRAGKRAGA